ncbi:hypothetical protein FRB91_004686 [Serendipita sp. 411]|nr:hypothetical protein FRB91_004686 [Serendipita sp. 411]
MAYTKIVQVGAGGNLGVPVHKALASSGKFDITVVGRKDSTFVSPFPDVKVVKVDFSDHSALVNALKGNEAVVLTLGDLPTLEQNSKYIIDAAIEAGVKRVIPSEFGNDLVHLPGSTQQVFRPKLQVAKYLKEKENEIEWTIITTGPFFDWGLQVGFLGFDIPNRKVFLFSGGTSRSNFTTLPNIAQAVVGVLSSPTQFANRDVRVHDFYVSQQEIKAVLEEVTGDSFAVEDIDVAKQEETTSAALARGEFTLENIYGLIKAYVFGANSSASWGENDDTEAVGLPKKDLKTVIKEVVNA